MENINNMISGDWTKIDQVEKVTEITFSTKDELIAKMTFDFKNDKVLTEGDLSKVTGLEDNSEFIGRYKECSREVLKLD